MKLRIIAVFSIIILNVIFAAGQKRSYDIKILLVETSVSTNSKSIPVKVSIRNTAQEVLPTKGLKTIHFYLAKCFLSSPCKRNGDIYTASAEIPAHRIRENKEFAFEVNLASLYWKDRKGDPQRIENIQNFNEVPVENTYLYAGIKTLDGYDKKPIFKVENSNVISVTIK